MTDTVRLEQVIRKSGLKKTEIATQMGISWMSLQRKIHNHTEFKAGEIVTICRILALSGRERDLIFFGGVS